MSSESSESMTLGSLSTVHRPWAWLLGLLAAVFVWRVVFTAAFNLIPDECSYWAWSRRLDWSYFDNAGMVAYLIRLSTEIFGAHTPFTVRFSFLVLSGLGTFLLYRTSVILFGDRLRALAAAVALNLFPTALLGGSAAFHDNALLFFWIVALWAGAHFVRQQKGIWLYVMGIASGGAILSKYTGVLLLPCILLFLLWTPAYRKWLLRKEPWIGAVIGMLGAVPIIIWNIQYDWASLHHILFIGSGSPSTMRRISDGLGYHLAQFLLVSPLLYVAIVTGAVVSLRRNVPARSPAAVLLLSMCLPLVLFGIMAFKGHVEANWAFMSYPAAVVLAAEIVLRPRETGEGRWKSIFSARYLKWAVVVAIVPVALAALHAEVGLVPAAVEKRFAKEDRIIWETRGWDGLGEHVGRLAKEGETIAGDSYQMCASLEFNVPGNPFVRYLAPWKRPTQFDVWEPSFDNLAGRDVLFVSPKPLVPSSDVRTTIYESFDAIEPLQPYGVKYHGEIIREIHVYRCKKFDPKSLGERKDRSLFYRDY